MKLVKFNLLVDNKRCRTIDDIKDNFNIVDILEHYETGKFKKWLKVRKYEECYQLIESFDENISLLKISEKLCDFFEISVNEKDLQDEIEIYQKLKNVDNETSCKSVVKNLIKENKKLKEDFEILSQKNSQLKDYIQISGINDNVEVTIVGEKSLNGIVRYIEKLNNEENEEDDNKNLWRLPTLKELKTYYYKKVSQNFNGHYFWVKTDKQEIKQYDLNGKIRTSSFGTARSMLIRDGIKLEEFFNE